MGGFNRYGIICGVPNHQAVLYLGKSTISTGPWLQELCNQLKEGIQRWQSDVTLGPHREVIEHKCPRWFIGYWTYLIYSWFVDIYPLNMVNLSIVFCMLPMVKPSIATPGVSVSISSRWIITPFPMPGVDAEGEAGAVGCPVQKGEGRGAKLAKKSWRSKLRDVQMGLVKVKLVEFPWRRYRSMEMIFLNHMFLFTLLGPTSGKYHDYDGKAIFSIFCNPENFRCSLFVRTRLYEVIT